MGRELGMKPKADNLIWLDLEMTGLDTNKDRIIEIATIITDKDLNIPAMIVCASKIPNFSISFSLGIKRGFISNIDEYT